MIFNLHSRRFYGILDLGYVAPDETISVATQMLEGGVEILQLRAKKLTTSEVIKIALPLVPLCKSYEVPFIINDHPEVVVESGADGLHIGQDDISIDKARDLIGAGKIVGLSTHSVLQAKSALTHKPDYIGFGPLFSTPTKPDYTSIGTANIREVHSIVDLPIYCIGGIKRDNLPEVLAAGAQRVVIVSGILQSGQIADYCRSCKAALQ